MLLDRKSRKYLDQSGEHRYVGSITAMEQCHLVFIYLLLSNFKRLGVVKAIHIKIYFSIALDPINEDLSREILIQSNLKIGIDFCPHFSARK